MSAPPSLLEAAKLAQAYLHVGDRPAGDPYRAAVESLRTAIAVEEANLAPMTAEEVAEVDRRYAELISSGKLNEAQLREAFDRRFPPSVEQRIVEAVAAERAKHDCGKHRLDEVEFAGCAACAWQKYHEAAAAEREACAVLAGDIEPPESVPRLSPQAEVGWDECALAIVAALRARGGKP